MTERIRQDIIDNSTGGVTMQKVLNSEIPHAKQLDISTGYFDVAGYGLLRQTLEPAAKDGSLVVRLLLGKGAMPPPEETFEEIAEHAGDEPLSVKAQLDGEALGSDSRGNATSLMTLLEMPNVQVRLGPSRFNHSKCYILGDNSVFVGSSNLTAGGLVGNYELNAGLYQPGVTAETRRWFDRMWEQASDAKEDLLRILRQSKFGVPANPHDVYMKMLFEKFKPRLHIPEEQGRQNIKLTAFQRDAVDISIDLINSYDGSIIADSTGLGKTNMGIEIMRKKIHNEGKKTMLVAPAQVLQSVWDAKLKDADISLRERISMESMGRESFLDDLHKYRNIDFVVIDESQNFRSKNAQRRLNLMKMLAVGKSKQVLLLTATPINNSLMDLYYQLSIITKERDDYFWESVGIVNLRKHMLDATNKDLQQGLHKIQQLLDDVMVRRTRSFIREAYHDDQINGQPITFPEHEYKPIKYDLVAVSGDVFHRLFNAIQSLTMAPYGLERYNMGLPYEERDSHRVLAHLQTVLLLKRFESSIWAVKTSINRKIRMYEYVEHTLRQGKILRVREFNKAIAKCRARETDGDSDGADPEDELAKRIQQVAVENLSSNYDKTSMLADIGSDLETLRSLQEELTTVTADKKFEAVRDTIMTDRALEREGCKVLIFTEYTDTAEHLFKNMCETFKKKEVLLIHGGTKPEARQKHIRRFSPKANLEDEVLNEKEADILISTEVLSEGQNLQDCNYVINYDLPWNPMRIVQRTGRVDRLTSEHRIVHSRACYPDKQLDELLQLMGNLWDKIHTAALVVGTDNEILGEASYPKEFNGRRAMDIRVLAGQGDSGEVIRRLESTSDMMTQSTPFNEIKKHVKEIGFEAMGSVPMGRRSGKRGEGQKAVLAYLQEGRTRRVHFVIYDYATGRAEVSENYADAIALVACSESTPLHLPMDGEDHRESFEQLLVIDHKAREAVGEAGKARKRKAHELQMQQKPTDTIKILVDAVLAGKLTEEDAEAARRVLESEHLRAWRPEMDKIQKQHEDDPATMCRALQRLETNLYAGDREADSKTPTEQDADLKLVGAMFIMDSFDPNFGKKGLEKHI